MRPLVWSWTIPAALGCNDQSFWVRVQSFGNQFFTDVRTVRIRCVDEVDIQFDRPAQNRERTFPILWRTPDAVPGEAHRSETQTINRKLFAQRDLSGQRCGNFFIIHDNLQNYLFHSSLDSLASI